MPEQAIAKVGYSHDAIIDMIVKEPGISQGELAERFGYTQGWMSRVINSDAFQHRLAERRKELVDPVVTQGLNERLRAVSARSTDVILDALDKPNPSKHVALEALKISARALHYGAKPHLAVQVNVQQNNGSPGLRPGPVSPQPDADSPVTVEAEVVEPKP